MWSISYRLSLNKSSKSIGCPVYIHLPLCVRYKYIFLLFNVPFSSARVISSFQSLLSSFIFLYKSRNCCFLESVRFLSFCSLRVISTKRRFGALPNTFSSSLIIHKVCHTILLTGAEKYISSKSSGSISAKSLKALFCFSSKASRYV